MEKYIKLIMKMVLMVLLTLGSYFLLMSAIFSYYGTGLTLFLGSIGFVVFVAMDMQTGIKLHFITKYSTALVFNVIYRLIELNNYEVDTRRFEFVFQGSLVIHEPEVKNFMFIDFNDALLIFIITNIILAMYYAYIYLLSKLLKRIHQHH